MTSRNPTWLIWLRVSENLRISNKYRVCRQSHLSHTRSSTQRLRASKGTNKLSQVKPNYRGRLQRAQSKSNANTNLTAIHSTHLKAWRVLTSSWAGADTKASMQVLLPQPRLKRAIKSQLILQVSTVKIDLTAQWGKPTKSWVLKRSRRFYRSTGVNSDGPCMAEGDQ